MRFLADVNVLSEPTKPQADTRVVQWLRSNHTEIVVDPIVMGEMWEGIVALPDGRRKENLVAWFRQTPARWCFITDSPGFGLDRVAVMDGSRGIYPTVLGGRRFVSRERHRNPRAGRVRCGGTHRDSIVATRRDSGSPRSVG